MKRRPRNLLSVDVGNSKAAGVFFTAGKIQAEWRWFPGPSQAQWKRLLRACFELRPNPTVLAVASVVPRQTRWLLAAAEGLRYASIHVFSSDDAWPFRIEAEHAESIGVDRLLNAAGLLRSGCKDGIVVDAGTAITLEVVHRGRFLGGAILPGFAMAARSLQRHTASLPRVDLGLSLPEALGGHTRSAIASGVRRGTAHAVAGLVRDLLQQLPARARVVTTGGQGEWLLPFLPGATYEPRLLHWGAEWMVSSG